LVLHDLSLPFYIYVNWTLGVVAFFFLKRALNSFPYRKLLVYTFYFGNNSKVIIRIGRVFIHWLFVLLILKKKGKKKKKKFFKNSGWPFKNEKKKKKIKNKK
jgi:hypothetical protein